MIPCATPKPLSKGIYILISRAEKKLKYFVKQLYTDRIIICLIIMMALAIIVIIGLSIAGKTPKALNGTVI